MDEPAKDERALPRDTRIALFAVGVVAVVALLAVVMPHTRGDDERLRESTQASSAQAVDGPVVTAPPLVQANAASRAPTQSMGAPAACADCGVVENVVAVHDAGDAKIAGFLMDIRMDDGSMRTIEDRGALAAGSRVRVEGNAVRALAP